MDGTELELLREWRGRPTYTDAMAEARLGDQEIQFMRRQIADILAKGSWRGDPRPTELDDLLTDLKSRHPYVCPDCEPMRKAPT